MNAREARHKLQVAATLLGTGMLAPTRPDKAVRSLAALRRWGPTSAAAYLGAAIRHPDRTAIVDERGTLTFGEVHKRTNALATGLQQSGVGEGDGIAIMCRNHRGFIEATVACSKLGANALYLNTAFASPQIADVVPSSWTPAQSRANASSPGRILLIRTPSRCSRSCAPRVMTRSSSRPSRRAAW